MNIYAHRGVHGTEATENTIEAFRLARESGADGFETDLRHTADGKVVLFHDHAVQGRPVTDLYLDDLRRLTGVDVPTLNDLLDARLGMSWNAEIKTMEAWTIARDDLRAHRHDILVTSFIHKIAVAAAATGFRSGILQASSPAIGAPLQPSSHLLDLVVCDWKVVDQDVVDEYRRVGWRLGTYGTISADEHRRAVGMGMDLLITDCVGHGIAAKEACPS